MNAAILRNAIPWLMAALFFCGPVFGNTNRHEQRTLVALRLIGHRLLLNAGDSTSRVLPIEKQGERFKLQFENEFAFNPDTLVRIINTVILQNDIAKGYNVEVLNCDSQQVVYDFEINFLTNNDMIPCKGREQPLACYQLYFSFINTQISPDIAHIDVPLETEESNLALLKPLAWLLFIIILAGFGGIFIIRKLKKPVLESNLIKIGAYQLNKITAELIYDNKKEELSSKELELLLLLLQNKNQTIEREAILNEVWNDDGAYVGRTLDVFISKLRKKLENDEKVKISNVRGVGYKLVLED